MLTRSQSTIVYRSGIRRTFAVVTSLPPQVILVHGKVSRAYGRERLHNRLSNLMWVTPSQIRVQPTTHLHIPSIRLLTSKFIGWSWASRKFSASFSATWALHYKPAVLGCLLDEGFSVTFHRTHGHGDAGLHADTDRSGLAGTSCWQLRNVTRVDLGGNRDPLILNTWASFKVMHGAGVGAIGWFNGL